MVFDMENQDITYNVFLVKGFDDLIDEWLNVRDAKCEFSFLVLVLIENLEEGGSIVIDFGDVGNTLDLNRRGFNIEGLKSLVDDSLSVQRSDAHETVNCFSFHFWR